MGKRDHPQLAFASVTDRVELLGQLLHARASAPGRTPIEDGLLVRQRNDRHACIAAIADQVAIELAELGRHRLRSAAAHGMIATWSLPTAIWRQLPQIASTEAMSPLLADDDLVR